MFLHMFLNFQLCIHLVSFIISEIPARFDNNKYCILFLKAKQTKQNNLTPGSFKVVGYYTKVKQCPLVDG